MEIRMAALRDASALREIYAPYVEKTAVTFEYEVPDEKEFARRIAVTLQRYPYLVALEKGEALGYAYASPFKERAAYDWAVETSIYVREDARGRGLGQALYQGLEKILDHQQIRNVNACIAYAEPEDEFLTNASARFHQRMGYRLAGRFHQCANKFGRWYDMIWMEKALGEHGEKPAPVVPVNKLTGLDELFAGMNRR